MSEERSVSREVESTFDEALANILSEYPAIWNTSSAAHRVKLRPDNAFQAIANALNSTVLHVEKRYRYLREKYRREKARERDVTKSGAASMLYDPWALKETLSFLDAVYVTRKTISSLSQPSNAEDPQWEIVDADVATPLPMVEDTAPWTMLDEDPSTSTASPSSGSPAGSATSGNFPLWTDPQPSTSKEPQPSTRKDPQPSTSKDPQPSTSWEKPPRSKSKASVSPRGKEKDIPEMVERIVDLAEAQYKEHDNSCIAFGRYVGLELSNLPPHIASELRFDIAKLLCEGQREARK